MTSRRQFVKLMAASGGAFVLGIRFSFADDRPSALAPSAWLRMEPDGSILIKVGKCEIGQGVRTSLPMILAEELDADFDDVRIETASPGPDFRSLGTGGSGSIMRTWAPLRQAGAAARTMLVAAAAQRWGVLPESCSTKASRVNHAASNRSLAYRELLADAAKQPVPAEPKLKKPSEFTLIGTPRARFDGPDIVTGKAVYGYDVRLPGMLYAVVARPPVLGSKAAAFDATETMKIPGVKKVVETRRGIAVVANGTWAAIRGRDALKVTWSESPHASFSSDGEVAELETLSESPGVTIRKKGAGRRAIEGSAKTLNATYHYPWAAHAAIEPVNSTAVVKDDSCEIWSPTQTPNGVQALAVQLLELPESAVKVNVILAGGGFGRRLGVDYDLEALEVAREMKGTPVHLVWTREDDMRHGFFQAPSVHRLAAGIDGAGKVVAWEHREVSIPHNARRPAPALDDLKDPAKAIGNAWGVYDTPYGWQSEEMSYTGVHSPTLIGPWRSVFSPSSVFARECFVDEVAAVLRRDEIDLRLEMLGVNDPEMPRSFEIDGDLVERDRMVRVIELVRQKARWGTWHAKGRAWGFAASYFHTGTYVAHAVNVSLKAKPRAGELPFTVHRVIAGVDCGIVVNPDGVAQQVESGILWGLSSMKNRITFQKGSVVEGSYDDFPVAMIEETPPVIETHIVRWNAERPNGVGEPVIDTVPPAVANAISKLAGKRVRRLPVTAADLT
ncbi:MAG: xanthine dehydrogenase family protein molybdopterin-binding subunit [Acidobacteria bacterium]|nr:xanthine dehydrogenase family protein molybdopterin-binding subunit [Acidobacteriota bacterium]